VGVLAVFIGRNRMSLKLYLIVATLACAAAAVWAQETEVAKKDVPPPVLAAFNKEYPNAKVLEWEKEIHSGKQYYEAETVDGKVARNVMYTPDGRLVLTEEKITVNEVPAAVTDSVRKQFPKALITGAKKYAGDGGVEYALDLKGANQKRVVIRGNGTLASADGKVAIDRN
jgi:hypothetical protein